jgi:hypothetical protein
MRCAFDGVRVQSGRLFSCEASITFVAERCVGTLGDAENERASGQQVWLGADGETVRGADDAKINREHELL